MSDTEYEAPRWTQGLACLAVICVAGGDWAGAYRAVMHPGQSPPWPVMAVLIAITVVTFAVAGGGLAVAVNARGRAAWGFGWIMAANCVALGPFAWITVVKLQGGLLLQWHQMLWYAAPLVGVPLAGIPLALRRRLEPLVEAGASGEAGEPPR